MQLACVLVCQLITLSLRMLKGTDLPLAVFLKSYLIHPFCQFLRFSPEQNLNKLNKEKKFSHIENVT